MALIEESEFKGNAMLVLRRNAEDRFPFQFGLSKAQLILDALPQIQAWVTQQEAKAKAKNAKVESLTGHD